MTAQSTRSAGTTTVLVALAFLTLALSGWWLMAEIFNDKLNIGIMRGELWRAKAERALAENRNDEAEVALRHSLTMSPTSSRAWYDLADLTARFDWLRRTSSRALKMSYYTGFNERGFVEPRLSLLAHVDTGSDLELELLLRREVRAMLSGTPEARTMLDRIYPGATDHNKEIIASEMRDAGIPLSQK